MNQFIRYLQIINNETDRGYVLIAAGYIDELLYETLRALMIDVESVRRELIEDMRPLGTLSARNLACRALGLISEDEFNDIDKIRRIRNEFAHKIDISFEDKKVVYLCENLKFRREDEIVENGSDIVMSTGVQFRTGANAIILRLVMRPEQVAMKRCTLGEWNYLDMKEPLEAIGTKTVDLSPDQPISRSLPRK